MTPTDLLHLITRVLRELRIPYIVTGSVASSYWGEARLTHDIDVVVQLDASRVRTLLESFPLPEFYASEEAALDAVRHGGQFNILHPTSGLKVDVMIARDTDFDASRFARAREVFPSEHPLVFAAPEDVILKKLEYYAEGGSDKHVRDIASICRIRAGELDEAYITRWASKLGLSDVWTKVRDRVRSG